MSEVCRLRVILLPGGNWPDFWAEGERLDITTMRRWREKVLHSCYGTDSRRKTMSTDYIFSFFLSHSPRDKAVVRPLAERLRADGLKVWPCPPSPLGERGFDECVLKPGDGIPAKTEEGLEHSRVLARAAVASGRRLMLCIVRGGLGAVGCRHGPVSRMGARPKTNGNRQVWCTSQQRRRLVESYEHRERRT
jgi:hypothetical protein